MNDTSWFWAQLRSEWLALDREKKRSVYSLLITCFVTCFALGFAFGWYDSPSYSSAEAAEQFAASQFEWTEQGNDILLRIRAGHWTYLYSSLTRKVSRVPLDPVAIASSVAPKRRTYDEEEKMMAIWGLAAAPGGVVATTTSAVVVMSSLPASLRAGIIGAAVVVGACGGWLGYHLAYHDKQSYDDPEFRRALGNPEMWAGWAKLIGDFLSRQRDCQIEQAAYEKLKRDDSKLAPRTDFFETMDPRLREFALQQSLERHQKELEPFRRVWNPHRKDGGW
jgi:hypothetical protein